MTVRRFLDFIADLRAPGGRAAQARLDHVIERLQLRKSARADHRNPFKGLPAPRRSGAGDRPRSAGSDPRRAHRRPRPEPEARSAHAHQRHGARQDHRHLHAHPRRGRRRLHPRHHHRPRPHRRRRHARRARRRARATTTPCPCSSINRAQLAALRTALARAAGGGRSRNERARRAPHGATARGRIDPSRDRRARRRPGLQAEGAAPGVGTPRRSVPHRSPPDGRRHGRHA